jgi:hypothetical protein
MKAQRQSKRSIQKRQRAKIRRGGKSACFVYGLKLNGAIYYVGQTRCALATRYRFHKRNASPTGSPVERWLVDAAPEIVMLVPDAVWDVDEILTIERLRQAGEPLLNATRGGNDRNRHAHEITP